MSYRKPSSRKFVDESWEVRAKELSAAGVFQLEFVGRMFNYKGLLEGKEVLLFSFVPTWTYDRGHVLEVQPASHVSTMEREEDRVYSVRVDRNACNLGGRTFLLRCPFCGSPVRRLYLPTPEDMLACRRCSGLRYRSRTKEHRKNEAEGNPSSPFSSPFLEGSSPGRGLADSCTQPFAEETGNESTDRPRSGRADIPRNTNNDTGDSV